MNPTAEQPLTTLLDDIEAKNKKAHKELCGICKDPASFRMSIPAREDDSDLVIQAGLDTIPKLVSALRVALEALEKCNDKCSDYSCGSITQEALTHLNELLSEGGKK